MDFPCYTRAKRAVQPAAYRLITKNSITRGWTPLHLVKFVFSENPYPDMDDTSDCHFMSCSYIPQIPLHALFSNSNIRVFHPFLKGVFQPVHTALVRTACDQCHSVACHFSPMFLIDCFSKLFCGKYVQRFQLGMPADIIQTFESQIVGLPPFWLWLPHTTVRLLNNV